MYRSTFFVCTILLITAVTARSFGQSTEPVQKDSTSAAVEKKDSSSVAIKPVYKMPKWYEMITNIPGDWSKYFTLTFRENKIPLYLTVAATTAATIATDDKVWQVIRKNHDASSFARKFDEFWTEVGDGRTQFGLAALFGAYGLISDDARAVRTASQIVQAVLAAGTVVQVMKHVTGRQTPNTATSPTGKWVFFPNQIEYARHVSTYDAFPSGHVTTTVAALIVIAENYPEVWWIRPVGYVVTGLVAWGMVGTGIHWYSDYPLALALGYTFGMIAAHPEGIPAEIAGKKINVMPTLVDNGFGISVGYSF
ncbi:MAG: phosphatase PAP2 family protein [Bacteroidetes bacterium]|nr:phosphatase PAP2 family protein [Bacteroidota bacterium]